MKVFRVDTCDLQPFLNYISIIQSITPLQMDPNDGSLKLDSTAM